MSQSTYIERVAPIAEFAIIVDPRDNVAVVKTETWPNLEVALVDGRLISLEAAVPPGHRFATRIIPAGEFVLQFGQPIRTALGIPEGQMITHENMTDDVPVVRDLPENLYVAPANYIPENERETFLGFRRPDGRVGTRNYILIVPTSMCASHEAQQISIIAEFTLYDRQKYPNVGGVILIDLGCEKTNLSKVEEYLLKRKKSFDKPVAKIGIQEVGGTQATIARGLKDVEQMLPEVNRIDRRQVPVSEIVLGVKCGGSDGFSGISANPSLGRAADFLVRSGGTVLITEVPEFCGAEHILANRAKDAATGRAVYRMVDWYKDYASKFGAVLNQNPSPGNVMGGLLNITIKSLGAIAKAGTTRVEGVVEYAERPTNRGLNLMQGPGYDQESTPGLVAAGATVVVFTTGRGTTIGNAIVPVIKLASNSGVYERMQQDLDLSAGGVIDGTETLDSVGQRVFEHVCKVATGDVQAKAEKHKHREFQFWAEQTVSL